MVIGILWTDKLAARMFVDFYKKIYLKQGDMLSISPSYYNSADIREEQITRAVEASEGRTLFVLMEIPEALDTDKAPSEVLESCDMVLALGRDMVPDTVKVVSSEQMAIVDRFNKNIEKFSTLRG
jgi:hypothetical protein